MTLQWHATGMTPFRIPDLPKAERAKAERAAIL